MRWCMIMAAWNSSSVGVSRSTAKTVAFIATHMSLRYASESPRSARYNANVFVCGVMRGLRSSASVGMRLILLHFAATAVSAA